MTQAAFEARALVRDYGSTGGFWGRSLPLRALKGVSLRVEKGKTLAIVGESGCGKSTLARIVTLIDEPTSGELFLDGTSISKSDLKRDKGLRKEIQIVFQNPYGSLNPRQTVGKLLEEPLLFNTRMSAQDRQDAVYEMLRKVGLKEEHYGRYPHMFSGGQRQRIAIARALMLKPRLLVLDEPVSALDLSVQAQVLNLLSDLQKDMGLTYIFISHDLSVVRHLAHEVMVMYKGEVVEEGPVDTVFDRPQADYTRKLLAATPTTDLAAIKARIAAQANLMAQK
ncbi:ABC transporter ATP-binding protein [Devosia ginsengisoli]|uniref:Dipeptide ABC transporter ATP-binding protein n=1 Tax=Devosia ginsengisoli TaxID=400770 RepID=A0A5B8LYF4_9HYPH|nr:dipeptide ABC transporter ATP-binding protein [Devosia ginsengisoli]QDZ12714.1 dipeptide ABC transporter ATP-binding protein [Devosia ginsengisoli]